MKEWEDYKIKGGFATTGTELNTVRHVAHAPTACRIIEDRKIKAGLVYDESRLKKSRISVTWVSANTWAWGSIYGTVEFRFNWKQLIERKKIYWVEAITTYRPDACRQGSGGLWSCGEAKKPSGNCLLPRSTGSKR